MRTLAENSSPSEMVHSASLAPGRQRAFTTSPAQFGKMVFAHPVPPTVIRSILMVGNAHPHRHALAFLAADAHAFVQPQVVAHHADVLERLGTIAMSVALRTGRVSLPILDEVALGGREDRSCRWWIIQPGRRRIHAVESLGNRADNVFGLALRRPA